jgi:hypothetical protein
MVKLGLWLIGLAATALTAQRVTTTCAMVPPYTTIRMPASPVFTWLPDEATSGACESIHPERWQRSQTTAGDLVLNLVGPEGSGRYWTITIGRVPPGAHTPDRGVCLATTTSGWPILGSFRDRPLPWIEDVDRDSSAEVIIWTSFALRAGAAQFESGLMPWVYHVDRDGTLTLDHTLSRRLAGEVARAYRAPAPNPLATHYKAQRQLAADALEAYSSAACTIPRSN